MQRIEADRLSGPLRDATVRRSMRRLLIVAVSAALSAPASALAADPILALRDVQPGARCSGLTVVRGTAISSFDVEVLDVLDRQRPEAARILVRVSGPAVAATGLGPGFSGSPIYWGYRQHKPKRCNRAGERC